MLERVPLPICGVALGVAGLANIVLPYSEVAAYVLALLSASLIGLFLARCVRFPSGVRTDLGNPVFAAVSGTLSMALMILSPLVPAVGVWVWGCGMALHIAVMVFFTVRFVPGMSVRDVNASVFVVYVGIGAAAITSPAFGMVTAGRIAAVVSVVLAFAILGLLAYRTRVNPALPEPMRPLTVILAAPFSLCLLAYIRTAPETDAAVLGILGFLSITLYVYILTKVPSLLRLPFYPSFAAMTFPMAVCSLAVGALSGCADGALGDALFAVSVLQAAVAFALVFFVLYRFMAFIVRGAEGARRSPHRSADRFGRRKVPAGPGESGRVSSVCQEGLSPWRRRSGAAPRSR